MKKPLSRPNGYLALFATFLVVGGVVFAAVLATPKINPDAKPLALPEPAVATANASSSGGVLIVEPDIATLYTKEGSKSLKWPDDVKLLGQPISQLEGADVQTGERAYLASEFKLAESTGIHSPDGRRSLFPSPAKADGTGSVEVRLGDEKQTVVLRLQNGRGIKDAMPIGWWGAETIAVVGRATSTRMAYAVNLAGEVTPVASIPDNADHLSIQDGNLWYVTLEPGQGLESPPGPPSDLHRVSPRSEDSLVVHRSEDVILQYAAHGSVAAYHTDSGDLVAVTSLNAKEIPLGRGIPLLFIDDTHLLINGEGRLIKKDIVTGQVEEIDQSVPDEAAIFSLPFASTLE